PPAARSHLGLALAAARSALPRGRCRALLSCSRRLLRRVVDLVRSLPPASPRATRSLTAAADHRTSGGPGAARAAAGAGMNGDAAVAAVRVGLQLAEQS